MKQLIVSPQAGMCNRFRTLCCALILGRICNRTVRHCWIPEPPHPNDSENIRQMRRSTWCDFFADELALPKLDLHPGVLVNEVYSEWEPGDYWYERQCSAIRRLRHRGPIIAAQENADLLLHSNAELILWESSITLRPSCMSQADFNSEMHRTYVQHFKPLGRFQKVVDDFAAQAPFVGIHIRRGDLLQDVPAARMSARAWAASIRRGVGPQEGVYLCTDDEAFGYDVASRLGDLRILRLESQAEAIDQAFLEFLCLSRATRVFGTVMSSFSLEAARFSGIEVAFCRSRGHEVLGKVVSGLRWAKKRTPFAKLRFRRRTAAA